MARTHVAGRRGEGIAAAFLVTLGFAVLKQNSDVGGVEVDLLCHHRGDLVIVEVKSRVGGEHPGYALDRAKLNRLRKAARALEGWYPDRTVRVDAVTVHWHARDTEPVIEHYPDVLT